MEIPDLLRRKRKEILQIASSHGAFNVRIFGSTTGGDARKDSDIDFLVDMEPGRSLLDLGALMLDLQDMLGREVDVVTEGSIYWILRRRVLKEARPL